MDDGQDPPDEGWGNIETAIVPSGLSESGRSRPCLVVLSGPQVGELVRVDQDLTVGRGRDAGFRVVDDGVSREHFRLVESADGDVELYDAGSSNGTFVNDQRVTQVVLQDGDRIRIGTNVVLKFAITDDLDEQFQHQMLQAAVIDGLTGLYNRRRLMEQLDLELQHSQRHGTPLTLVMLDLDHFKQVNDTHGHTVGDAVLQGFAQILSSATRTDDMAARLGGEEFVLLCRNLNSLVGAGIADRLRQLVARSALAPTRPELRITVSAGVASVPDPRIQTADQLLEAADRALYAAKASGRNQVCIS